ncbi:amidohydrolase [Flavobacteriaceae bacterium]|jgi:amidohydrolase|nr:amidohydrolase [Flavobacteriaceae bacterium]
MKNSILHLVAFLLLGAGLTAQKISSQLENKVIQWRHEIHQNPELSNREFKTAEKIAAHLRSLGIEVQTGIAHTGVVGLLKGKRPGKVLALRADMDALPVSEQNDLPYRSKVKATFSGQETGVMHACGHDTHVAILMGVAEYLAQNNDFAGAVKFIFQPAEEGPPQGEKGGARLMVEEGVLENPKVDAIYGLHINSATPVGQVRYKSKGIMAAAQRFVIEVQGKQAHGSEPWMAVDPILISAKIIDGLQTIISRNSKLTKEGAVISVGSIHSGIRFNIIPESARMVGTVRTLDEDMKQLILRRMNELVPQIAAAYGGSATVNISETAALTYNDPALTQTAVKSLKMALGEDQVVEMRAVTGAEDFSAFQEKVPGFYFYLGGLIQGNNPEEAPSHHTPEFLVDDAGLIYGVKAMVQLSLDFLN